MPTPSVPGRALVTRRAIAEEVRRAAVSSYGVVAVGGRGPATWLLALLTPSVPGIRVRTDPELLVEIRLTIAPGLPLGQVVQNVSDQIRYALRTALAREPADIRIRVERVRPQPVPRSRRGDPS